MENRAERKKISSKVDFIIDADIIPAQSVDVSDTGISFQTDTPIRVRMRLGDKFKGYVEDRVADLIWAQKNENGSTTYGLQFIEDEPNLPTPKSSSIDVNIW